MKRTIQQIILILIFLTLNTAIFAQSSADSDCDQMIIVMKDGVDNFSSDHYLTYYEYNFKLWNDEGRELYYDEYGNSWADFYFYATYNYSEAEDYLIILLEKVKKCLPPKYFLSGTESEYSLKYYEFSDERDKGLEDNPAYMQVLLSLDEKDDFYYLTVSIYAPAK